MTSLKIEYLFFLTMMGLFLARFWYKRNKIVNYVILPIVFLFIWVGLTYYQAYQLENVFTILIKEYPRSQLTQIPIGEIYKGQKIIGRFSATENYLGIIGFRFWTFYRLNYDYLVFRIRDASSSKWYYQNLYKTDQFQPNQYFTFGFPVIPKSKGTTYVFEIESTLGTPDDAVGISDYEPTFIIKYKYPRSIVTSSYESLASFTKAKISNLMYQNRFTASSFIFFIPLIIYLISLSTMFKPTEKRIKIFLSSRINFIHYLGTLESTNLLEKGTKIIFDFLYPMYQKLTSFSAKVKFILDLMMTTVGFMSYVSLRYMSKHPLMSSSALLYTGVLLDIVLVRTGDVTVITLLLLWVILINLYHLLEKQLIISFFVFLGIAFPFYYLGFEQVSERAGAWAWIFLSLYLAITIYRQRKLSSFSSV